MPVARSSSPRAPWRSSSPPPARRAVAARWAAPRRPPPRGVPAGAPTRGASLLRRALLQPVLETAIEISVDRQIVGEELRVDLDHLRETLAFLPPVNAERRHYQHRRRQQHARRQRAPAAIA